MTTPELHLETLFRIDRRGRVAGTREPDSRRGPVFKLVRGRAHCAWAVRADTPDRVAAALHDLAAEETPVEDGRVPPLHADRYRALAGEAADSGPAFVFPDDIPEVDGVVFLWTVDRLVRHFPDWSQAEMAGRAPIAAIERDGHAVSVCCCARRSGHAAEAGLETAAAFRRAGLGACVTAAWATAVRASGRVPLYSTSWSNTASLAVAARLNLVAYANAWSFSDRSDTLPSRC
ncbi:MAG: GNAT family N-acetyltransferase [Gammaproteobacteria bacterium]|nr:GNAT family N-acetyltransferase [Gammaproteobacteria bacterium]